MAKRFSVLLVDDQPAITKAYESLSTDYPEISELHIAHTEKEYWSAIKKHHKSVGVVVMDLMLNTSIPIAVRTETMVQFSGFSLIQETLAKYPKVKFVVLSQYMHDTNILAAYRMGAKCFIAKHQETIDGLVEVLKKVVKEGVVIPETYNRTVVNKIIGYQDTKLCELTDEELTIVEMLLNGFETEDIREATNSKSTFSINNKISGMLKTVGLPSRNHLILYAIKAGMQPKENS